MIVKSERVGSRPEAVEVCGKDVWLRRSIEEEHRTDERGDVTVYVCDEVHFTAEDGIDEAYALAYFDELWAAHELDGMTDAQRIDALMEQLSDAKQAIDDANAALMEIGDLVGGGE